MCSNGLTNWASGISLYDTAEICDWLFKEPALPINQVPDKVNSDSSEWSDIHFCSSTQRQRALPREVGYELDISNDKLVFQQQVSEQSVFLQRRDRLGTKQTDQQLITGILHHTGSAGTSSSKLWKTQRLQYAVPA